MSKKLIRLTTTAPYKAWLKSEYLSVRVPLLPIWWCHFSLIRLCYYAVPFPANYGTVPYSLIFTPIAALLQAVLQNENETIPERPSRNEEQNNTG